MNYVGRKKAESLADSEFQTQKKPPLSDFDLHLMVPKAGLEHRNYPYDLKRLKLNIVG